MKLHDKDSLTLDFSIVLDADELAKIIGKDDGPTKPGWARRIAEAVTEEGFKQAIKIAVVETAKRLT